MFVDAISGFVNNDGASISLDGSAATGVGESLNQVRFDPNLLRPFIDQRGRRCVLMNVGARFTEGVKVPIVKKFLIRDVQNRLNIDMPVWNATSLRKEDWIELDRTVLPVVRQPLRAYEDLAASRTFGGFDAMAKMTLEYEAMSDPGEAVVDMDGITDGRTDEPKFLLRSLPLPITHSDFWFSARRIAVSRNSGVGLDTTMGEAAGRRVGETIERTTIGTEAGVTYGTQATGVTAHDGTSTVYGYTNFPDRITKTDLTTPTAANPEAVLADVLEMMDLLNALGFYGPFVLYHSTAYSRFLNDDYFRSGSTSAVRSLRQRLMETEGLSDIRRLNFLTTGYQLLMIQLNGEYFRAIDGLQPVLVQWETVGGQRKNFKVMAIQVPQLRSDYNGNAPAVHGTTS